MYKVNLHNSKTVQCKYDKQVKLDKTYYIKNLETYASGSGCLFQNGTNKGQFSILNFIKCPLEIDEEIPVQISPISYQGLSGDKYLDYILLTSTQRHNDFTVKFIPKYYEFTKTLQNINLKKLYHSSDDSQKAKMWLKLAELVCCLKIQEFIQYLKMPLVKGPVVLMTDCTKFRPKVIYSQKFGTIMESVLPSNQTKIFTYEDIHVTIKLIQENDAIANQIRGFILKIPISKVLPVMIATIPTKGNTKANKIS
ncbi:hypothetical protein GLOIN_2v1774488 [Rhizophagus clarus]|uniref:Uncharacterized protein n=1 Tax=Rhizophagus clarus TaxID=94130 RepID=A0A8H3KQZ4_9GLOM|nr:hypothetical protein GLOIN_2v1774488 [Rhizophagus clarus]